MQFLIAASYIFQFSGKNFFFQQITWHTNGCLNGEPSGTFKSQR